LLPAPVLQTPATESESNYMDTSSEGCDGKRVVAEKMSSSDALSFGSSERASSEEPPCPTSVQDSSTQRQLAMLLELFHAQAGKMQELEEELEQLRAQAGSSHPQFQPQAAGAASEFAPLMVGVTPKDVILEAFHGSKDPESLVIDKEFFLRLLSWLRASVILIILNPNKTSKQSGEGKGAGTLKAPPYIGFANDPSLLTSKHGEHGGQSQLAMHSHACRDSENHVHVRR
jgi:hypothetical protein